MGLQEKRAYTAIEEQYVTEYQKELNAIVGKELPIQINWDTFELEHIKFVPSVCLQRLMDAMKEVCKDNFGKEAVQESMDKIEVNCIVNEGAEENKKLDLSGKTFTLTACWGGHHSGFFTDLVIREYLESKL